MRLEWQDPYSEATLDAAETRWGFRFQPDLRRLYLMTKPVGVGIWDWDAVSDEDWKRSQDFILGGIAFDVIYNGFWIPEWGERPDLGKAPASWSAPERSVFVNAVMEDVVRPKMAHLPPLIPIFGHRYMPSEPHAVGLPILSIMQTDIIYYGWNLRDYFHKEFGVEIDASFGKIFQPYSSAPSPSEITRATFWSDLIDGARNGR